MTLDEIVASLFPCGQYIEISDGILKGRGQISATHRADIVGITGGKAFGVDDAILLSAEVLRIIDAGGSDPLIVLVDSDSQRMSKHDELLGLNEYLSHLAKSLQLANARGHRTVGLLYGHSAAGAFIATALATQTLVALPGAHPEVMDLPSVAKVTKLPLDVLKEMAKATPVFAPGLDNLVKMGAVHSVWNETKPLSDQLLALLSEEENSNDRRAMMGRERDGRSKALDIAERVYEEALHAF